MILSAWLTDPTAWGTVVAAIAVVLSQIPPLKVYFQRAHLKLSFPDRFTVLHHLGNPQIMMLVTLENVCARKVTVTKMEGLLLPPTGPAVVLPGQQYISRQLPGAGQLPPELLLVGISLKPDESWGENVRFFASFSEDEEDYVNRIIGGMKKDIWNKQMARQMAGSLFPTETDEKLVADATAFFTHKFWLTKGNYTFLIAARDERGQLLAVQGTEFTLYENSISAMREATEEYKYGAGVYYPNQLSAGGASPRPRLIPEDRARELFEKKYPS